MRYYVQLDEENYVVATFVDAGEGFPQKDLDNFFEIGSELFRKIGPGSKIVNDEIITGGVRKILLSEQEFIAVKFAKISYAQSQVNPLQYAVDLSIATDDEVAKLKEWKTYLVELNRVDTTQESIEWPSEPIS